MKSVVGYCATSLFGIWLCCSPMLSVSAQDIPMRQRSGWDGRNSGTPAQRWTPGIEQQELKRQQEILHGWQDAERRSYETRMTPEHWIRDLKAKIQQTHASGDFAGEAAAWSNLGQTIQAPGFGPYSQGIDIWTCYKGEVGARLGHIGQVAHRDTGTEIAEWAKVRMLSVALAGHDPSNAQWPFLAGMAFVKQGPGSFGSARQWLTKCMNVPTCSPDLKAKCQSAMAAMKAEEDRLRKEAEERAARQKALAAARAKEEQERLQHEQKEHGSGKLWTMEQAAQVTAQAKLMDQIHVTRNARRWNEALNLSNKLVNDIPDNNATLEKKGFCYMLRADALYNLGRDQEALADCDRAERVAQYMTAEDQTKLKAGIEEIRKHCRYYMQKK